MTRQQAVDAEVRMGGGSTGSAQSRTATFAPPSGLDRDMSRPVPVATGRPAKAKTFLPAWWRKGVVIALLVAGVAASFMLLKGWTGSNAAGSLRPYAVKRGPMKVQVTADGTIRSDKTVDVRSQVQGKASILEIVPESTRIEKAGQFLVKLDTTEVEKLRDTQYIKVQQLAAAASQADSDLEIQSNLNRSDISKADQTLETAKIEVEKYEKGDFPAAVQTAQNAITLAKQQLSLAENRLDWSTKLKEKGYISGSELEADQLARDKSRLDVSLANTNLDVLQKYTYVKESAIRRTAYVLAIADLDRTKAKAAASESKYRSAQQTTRESYGLEKKQLDKLDRQVAAGTILAPQPGLVVYYSTGKPRWQVRYQVDVGVQVQENDSIISLPDLTVMVADVTVPEAKRTELEDGQPAVVRVAVQPNSPLVGRVKSRGIMPVQQDPWRRGDVQQFQVVIDIPNPPEWLLPGLACSADVTIREMADVLQVPVQAVFQRDGQHFCYVVDGSRIRAVPVLVGMDDDKMVEIKAGLKDGWQVLESEPENGVKIALEPPTFERPKPAVLTLPATTTQPPMAQATRTGTSTSRPDKDRPAS